MEKAIFIDLDGTLLTDDKEISTGNIEAINKAKSFGYEIVICTARALNRAEKFFKLLDCNYIIYANGNIFDCKKKKPIYENIIPTNEILKVYKIVDHDSVYVLFISGNTRYINKKPPFEDRLLTNQGQTTKDIFIEESIESFLTKNNVVQILVLSQEYETMKNIKDVIKKMSKIKIVGQSRALTDTSYPVEPVTSIDVTNKNAGKGRGVKEFCKIFNIAKKNRIAIGDDFSDFPMFEACGYKVAMENSLTELKDIADHITDDNNSDGVAKFIEIIL